MTATSLKERISGDIKAAMKAGQRDRLGTLRMIHAAIRQREIDERVELGDARVIEELDRLAKRHRESIAQYGDAGRDDLVAKEEAELAVVREFLPEQLDDTALAALVDTVIASTGATSMKDMGRVMAELKPRVQGRADMASVSAAVKRRLG